MVPIYIFYTTDLRHCCFTDSNSSKMNTSKSSLQKEWIPKALCNWSVHGDQFGFFGDQKAWKIMTYSTRMLIDQRFFVAGRKHSGQTPVRLRKKLVLIRVFHKTIVE